MQNPVKVLAIIPCFNEADSIAGVLNSISSLSIKSATNLPIKIDTLVIDDGSTDKTYEVASRLSRTIRLIVNLGIGGGVQTGFRYAEKHNYDCAIQVDGDGQHPPDQIQKLLDFWLENKADMVIGTRFLEEKNFRSSFLRRMGIRAISHVLKLLYKQTYTDPTSGFRLYGRNVIKQFSRFYPRDFPEPIAIALAAEQGRKICEAPVRMSRREHGTSSIGGIKNVTYMVRVTGYIFFHRIGRYL